LRKNNPNKFIKLSAKASATVITSMDVLESGLLQLTKCCPEARSTKISDVMRHFVNHDADSGASDMSQATDFIKQCREKVKLMHARKNKVAYIQPLPLFYNNATYNLTYHRVFFFLISKTRLKEFIKMEYVRCYKGSKTIQLKDGSQKVCHIMEWSIDGVKLCRESFARCYSVTTDLLDLIAKAMKMTHNPSMETDRNPTEKTTPARSTIAEMEMLIDENLLNPPGDGR
jgi:hypothetical protein